MPNRIIKESICTSETIDGLSWFEECFWYRLIVNCDDYGRFDARPAVLKSRLFPLKERITLKDVSSALTKLADIGCVVLYDCDGRPYLYLPAWEVHQTIRAKKSRYPDPHGGVKSSEIICTQMHADAPVIQSNPNPNPIPPLPPLPPTGGADPVEDLPEPLRGKTMEWLAYKRERRQGYKDQGLKSLVSQLKKYAGEHGTGPVCEAIDQAIANRYQGIVWESIGRGKGKPNRAKNMITRSYTTEDLSKIGVDLLGD